MRESVQYQHFAVPSVAPDERFEYWRSWFGQAADAPVSIEPVGQVPHDFHSAAEALRVGSVSFTELHFGPSVGSWQRDGMAASGLVRIAIFCRARGAIGHWYGRSVALLDGCPVLISATDGSWRAPAGMHTIAVNVPRAVLPLADATIDRIVAQPVPARAVIFESLVAPMLLGLVGQLGALARCVDAAAPNRSDLEATWLSMAALLLRSLDGRPADGVEFAPARRLQAQRFIAANLGDQHLNPDEVARAMSISRRALYASFADGEGIAAAIRTARLRRAHALLADPAQRHRTIAAIAAEVGIVSPAHFSRLFRAEYGQTPRAVRREVVGSCTRRRESC